MSGSTLAYRRTVNKAIESAAPAGAVAPGTGGAKMPRTASTPPAKSASKPDAPKRDIKDVWIEYKKNKTEPLRNTLMENYLHLVRYNAERIHVKLPDEVELDDLMSAGIFGLMDAINAFDLERGVKFETYCAPRIRGAILDELRSMDWVPRLVRSRAHKLDGAAKQLETELGRAPTNDEIARQLKIPMSEFEKMAKDASAVGLVSLSRKWFETDSNKDVREIDVLEDKRGADPVREIQRKDLKELITKGLSRAERLIIILYYFEEMTMKEIGATLDLSESRVSQMHSSILARLKAQMADRKKELQQASVE
jgi:RNA polymerase sigma factor for flagellar operon FliA